MDLKYDPHLGKLLKRYDYLSVKEASGLGKLKALGRADGV
jgi:hypothetical protein